MLYWERQWRQWAAQHERGQRLRLTPVVPVVFYTGKEPWDGFRTLAELFDARESVRACIPAWQTWLCDLTQFDAQELVHRPEALWQALAVVRGEQAESKAFLALLKEVVDRLEPVAEQDRPRWDQLQKLVLFWTIYRRSKKDQQDALALVRSTNSGVRFRKEIDAIMNQVELTYEQEIIRDSIQKGRNEKEAEAAEEQRGLLRQMLQERFGTIPEAIQQASLPRTSPKSMPLSYRCFVRSSPLMN